jgi:hypothetical protein
MLRITQQLPKQISIMLNLLALFIITYMVVATFYRVLNMQLFRISGPVFPAFQDVEMDGDLAFALPEYSMIVTRNIFKTLVNVEPPPLEEKVELPENLEETTLQLILLGTVAGDPGSARAIILDVKGESQGIYKVADSVQGAKIEKILRGKVILRHGEKVEMLSMAGDEEIVQLSSGVERRGRLYDPAGDMTRTGSRGEMPERIKARKEFLKLQREALAPQIRPAAKFTKSAEARMAPAPLSLLDKKIRTAEPQATRVSSAGGMLQLQEPSMPAAKVPDLNAVEPFIASWAEAWQQKNIETYLSHYATDFSTPGNISRAAWEQKRRQRLAKPKFIKVQISGMEKQKVNDSHVQATFIQEYQSDIYVDKVVKTLDLIWENGSWLIAYETSRAF